MFSGVAIAALGLAVLRIRASKAPALAFSAFAALRSLRHVAASVGNLAADPATGLPGVDLNVLLFLPLYVPLIYFVSAYPWRTNVIARSQAALVAFATPALGLLALYAAGPDLFMRGA